MPFLRNGKRVDFTSKFLGSAINNVHIACNFFLIFNADRFGLSTVYYMYRYFGCPNINRVGINRFGLCFKPKPFSIRVRTTLCSWESAPAPLHPSWPVIPSSLSYTRILLHYLGINGRNSLKYLLPAFARGFALINFDFINLTVKMLQVIKENQSCKT